MNEVLKNIFENASASNSISHAYLFANVKYEDIQDELERDIQTFIFKSDVLFYNNPDIYVIEPEKNVIKKEKIIDVQKEVLSTSQENNTKIYIIKECEKLNLFAANSLLKNLEEPAENVYCILLTSNIDFVIDTIKSRCQCVYLGTPEIKSIPSTYDEDFMKKVLQLVESLEKQKEKVMAYSSSLIYKNFSKDEYKDCLLLLLYFYTDCVRYKNNINLEKFFEYETMIKEVCNINNQSKLLRKTQILSENIELLNYNINMNSFVDKFTIEFWRA